MTNTIWIDQTAMMQGAIDAYEAGEIGKELYSHFRNNVTYTARRSNEGRWVISHTDLMIVLSYLQPQRHDGFDWLEFSQLRSRLGDSIASGITVASQATVDEVTG